MTGHQTFTAPRADGQHTPLCLYPPPPDIAKPPLALISHGAGGSEMGYGYLARALQTAGWRVLVMAHAESGLEVLQAKIKASGFRDGLLELVSDPAVYQARLLDIAAALDAAETLGQSDYRLLLGHSMGSATVMVEAGVANHLGASGLDRFDAYAALSPHGPGRWFPPQAWRSIHKPMLLVTGTADQPLEGDWHSRLLPFDDLPPGGKWLAVIANATHMHFAGIGPGVRQTEDATTAVLLAFLAAVRSDTPAAPPPAIAHTTLRAK
ncbi:MAG: hypothetical protein ACKN9T_17700 [Candidatus Methylumidiphilus sp.]